MRQTLGLSLLIILLTGCTATRQLKVHHSNLTTLASSNLGAEARFDALANTLVEVLETGLSKKSPVATYRYLHKFVNQNRLPLETLTNDLGFWTTSLSPLELAGLGVRTATKPYARKLVTLIPNTENRLKNGGYKLSVLDKLFLLFTLRKVK